MTGSTKILGPGEGETLTNHLGANVLIRITGQETAGAYSVVEAEQPTDALTAPLHIHDLEDEAIQVLEGRLIVEVDGKEYNAPAGSYIFIPRGAAQRFWNPGPENARYQSIFTPAGQENYFRRAYSLDVQHEDFQEKLANLRKEFGLRYPSS
jgi:quercetin dioxygenase-like cupin family protein